MKSIYCPKCDKRVETEVTETMVALTVRRVDVHARQLQAVCPNCGEAIADEEISRANLESAFAAYRVQEGLLSPEAIRQMYIKYGLTQKTFGTLLNLGGATLSRYEHGALQTKQIDAAMRQAAQPENMLALLDEHAGEIPISQAESARQTAYALMANQANGGAFDKNPVGNFHLVLSDEAPNVRNGFRRLDWSRVAQMVVYMAKHCDLLGKVKLNKAMFYADFSCFVETACSMSGLVYARAPRGPIVDQYDALFGEMVRQGYLEEEQVAYGSVEATVYKSSKEFDSELFTCQELAILERVASFVNGFETAAALSEYSHKERLWMESDDGHPLSYLDAYELNGLERFVEAQSHRVSVCDTIG